MDRIIINNLSGKRIIFLVTGTICFTMLLITLPKAMSYAGGLKILDMMPAGYDHAYVNSLMKALGEEGRHTYLYQQLPLDMIFPSLNAITFCLIIGYFLILIFILFLFGIKRLTEK